LGGLGPCYVWQRNIETRLRVGINGLIGPSALAANTRRHAREST